MKNWNIPYNGQFYPAKWYEPEIDKSIGECSFDTETTMVEKGQVADFVLGIAYNGSQVYFIKRQDLKAFMNYNKLNPMFMAYAPFDLLVSEKVKAIDCAVRMTRKPYQVYDVQIFEPLIRLGTTGDLPKFNSLKILAQKYLGMDIDKEVKDDEGNDVRTSYGKFLNPDMTVNYDQMSHHYFTYAGTDSIVTYDIFKLQIEKVKDICLTHDVDFEQLLSHEIQLSTSVCLAIMSNNGFATDQQVIANSLKVFGDIMNEKEAELEKFGYKKGTGSTTALQGILMKSGLKLKKTKTGKFSTSAIDLEDFAGDNEFIQLYLDFKDARKSREFLLNKPEVVHASFTTMVKTGRTSSYNPNFQNIPKIDAVRNMFKARDGHLLLSVDYSALELSAQSQVSQCEFGYSKLGETINNGIDPHLYLASKLVNKPFDEITKSERNKAKSANFGFWGGMGIPTFIIAQKKTGTVFTEDEAKELKKVWMETYPEAKLYLSSNDKEFLINSGLINTYSEVTGRWGNEQVAYTIFKSIISGNVSTKGNDGKNGYPYKAPRPFTKEEIEWAFSILEECEFRNKDKHKKAIATKTGSRKLYGDFTSMFNHIVYKSGRVLVNRIYTESKNAPFQGFGLRALDWKVTA